MHPTSLSTDENSLEGKALEARVDYYFKILENLYGKVEDPVIKKFRENKKNYFNGIKGWQFPFDELYKANKQGLILTADIDFPGNLCALDCEYCFAKVGEKTDTYYRPDKGDRPLTIKEIKEYILQAKKLGLKSIKIIGYREPFHNPGIIEFIDWLAEKDIHSVIFTAGYTLGEQFFGHDLEKAVDFLAERPVSLMVKLHSIYEPEEAKIVGDKEWYPKLRDKHLKALLEHPAFTEESPTRLGIENVIATKSVPMLLAIYKYFKIYRNLFPDIDPPIPVGRTGTLEEAMKAGLMSQEELVKLATEIYRINKDYGVPFEGVSPYLGGPPCSQLPNGFYLTLSGKVLTCCGSDEEIGDVQKELFGDILNNNPYRKSDPEAERAGPNIYHICPYRNKRDIMTEAFVRMVEEELGEPPRPLDDIFYKP